MSRPPIKPIALTKEQSEALMFGLKNDYASYAADNLDPQSEIVDKAYSPAPEEKDEIGYFENMFNRISRGMDETQKNAYEKLNMDSAEGKGVGHMIESVFGKDALEWRIAAQDADIREAEKHIREKNAQHTPMDWWSKTVDYIGNDFADVLGSSMSMLGLTVAGAGAGMFAGPGGALALGAAGMSLGRYQESLAESGENYKRTVAELNQLKATGDPKYNLSKEEIHRRGLNSSNEVFYDNMKLLAMDIPATLIAFGPLAKAVGKATSGVLGKAGGYAANNAFIQAAEKTAYHVAKTPRLKYLSGAAKYLAVGSIEGAEEGLQFSIQNKATSKALDKDSMTLGEMMDNEEFQESVKSGFVLGGFMRGAGQVMEKVKEYVTKHKEDDLTKLEALTNQERLGLVFKNMQNGTLTNFFGSVRGTAAQGAFNISGKKNDEKETADSVARIDTFYKQAVDLVNAFDATVQQYPSLADPKNQGSAKALFMLLDHEKTLDEKLKNVSGVTNPDYVKFYTKQKSDVKNLMSDITQNKYDPAMYEAMVAEEEAFIAAGNKLPTATAAKATAQAATATQSTPATQPATQPAATPAPAVEGFTVKANKGPAAEEGKKEKEKKETKKETVDQQEEEEDAEDYGSRTAQAETEVISDREENLAGKEVDAAFDYPIADEVDETSRTGYEGTVKLTGKKATGESGSLTIKDGKIYQDEVTTVVETIKDKSGKKTERTEETKAKAIDAHEYVDKNGNRYIVGFQDNRGNREHWNKREEENRRYGKNASKRKYAFTGTGYLIPVNKKGEAVAEDVVRFYVTPKSDKKKDFLRYDEWGAMRDKLGLKPVKSGPKNNENQTERGQEGRQVLDTASSTEPTSDTKSRKADQKSIAYKVEEKPDENGDYLVIHGDQVVTGYKTKAAAVKAANKWNSEKKDLSTVKDNRNKKKTEKKAGVIKNGLKQIFESFSKLSEIGTLQQYSEYLDTVFPNSKIKDIFHHWSVGTQISDTFGDDLKRVKGIWLSKNPAHWKEIIKNKSKRLGINEVKEHWVIINSSKVWVDAGLTSPSGSNFPNGYDTIAAYEEAPTSYSGDVKPEFKIVEDFETVVKSKNQIHELGSAQDIDGFKKFVAQKKKAGVTQQSLFDDNVSNEQWDGMTIGAKAAHLFKLLSSGVKLTGIISRNEKDPLSKKSPFLLVTLPDGKRVQLVWTKRMTVDEDMMGTEVSLEAAQPIRGEDNVVEVGGSLMYQYTSQENGKTETRNYSYKIEVKDKDGIHVTDVFQDESQIKGNLAEDIKNPKSLTSDEAKKFYQEMSDKASQDLKDLSKGMNDFNYVIPRLVSIAARKIFAESMKTAIDFKNFWNKLVKRLAKELKNESGNAIAMNENNPAFPMMVKQLYDEMNAAMEAKGFETLEKPDIVKWLEENDGDVTHYLNAWGQKYKQDRKATVRKNEDGTYSLVDKDNKPVSIRVKGEYKVAENFKKEREAIEAFVAYNSKIEKTIKWAKTNYASETALTQSLLDVGLSLEAIEESGISATDMIAQKKFAIDNNLSTLQNKISVFFSVPGVTKSIVMSELKKVVDAGPGSYETPADVMELFLGDSSILDGDIKEFYKGIGLAADNFVSLLHFMQSWTKEKHVYINYGINGRFFISNQTTTAENLAKELEGMSFAHHRTVVQKLEDKIEAWFALGRKVKEIGQRDVVPALSKEYSIKNNEKLKEIHERIMSNPVLKNGYRSFLNKDRVTVKFVLEQYHKAFEAFGNRDLTETEQEKNYKDAYLNAAQELYDLVLPDIEAARRGMEAIVTEEVNFFTEFTGIPERYFRTAFHNYDLRAAGAKVTFAPGTPLAIDNSLLKLNQGTMVSGFLRYVIQNNEMTSDYFPRHMQQIFTSNKPQKLYKDQSKPINMLRKLASANVFADDIEITDSYRGVEGKRKDGAKLSNIIRRITNKVGLLYGLDKFKNNTFVNFHKDKVPDLVWLDGVKKSIDGASTDKFTDDDLTMAALSLFNNNGKDSAYHFIELLGDRGHLAAVETTKHSLEQAKLILGKDNHKYAEESIPAILKTLKKFLQQGDFVLPEGTKPEEFAELFAFNYAANKMEIDDIYQGNDAFYKDYDIKTKRGSQMGSTGLLLVKGLLKGVPNKIKSIILPDDSYMGMPLGDKTLDMKEVINGTTFISKKLSEQIAVSSGALYNFKDTVKALYKKTDVVTGEHIMVKSNWVVLDKAYALANGGEKGILYQMYLSMESTGADVLTFESNVKVAREELKNKGKIDYKNPAGIAAASKGWESFDMDIDDIIIQQDLRHDPDGTNMRFESGEFPVQVYRFLMRYPEFDNINNKFLQQQKKRFADLRQKLLNARENKAEFIKFLEERLKDNEEDNYIRTILKGERGDDTDQDLNDYFNKVASRHPFIQGRITQLLGNYIAKKSIFRIANRFALQEVGSLGVAYDRSQETIVQADGRLRGPRKQGKVVAPGTALIPKALEKQCIEKNGKKYLVIIRVPTTEMHSIALVEVVGYLPATMSNTIVTDPVTQQMAGSDNDGDQRFCCTMFKPGKDGKLSEDKQLSNEALEGLISILQNPEYFELNNIPINVEYFDDLIPKGKSQKSRFSFNSFKEMWNNNSDAKRGIAIASRTNGAFNYLRKIGVRLKGLPMINGKVPTSFGISTAEERILMATELANLTNIIVDNAKEGKMAKLGLSDATVNVYFVMRRLGIPVKDIIDIFTGTEAGQEIIQMLQEARSVASPFTKGGVFRALARKYKVPEGGIEKFNTTKMDNADVVALVKKMSDLAMETFNFSEIIRLNEDGIVNNNDYVQGQKLLRYMESMDNLLNSEDSNRIIRVEKSSNLTDNSVMVPFKLAMEAAEYSMVDTIFDNPIAKGLFYYLSLNQGKATGVQNVMNAMMQIALATEMNISPVMFQAKEVADLYKSVIENTPLSQYLTMDSGRIVLASVYRGYNMTAEQLAPMVEAMNSLPDEAREELMKYQVGQHGWTTNMAMGGFSKLFGMEDQGIISWHIQEATQKWNIADGATAFEINSILASKFPKEFSGYAKKSKDGTYSFNQAKSMPMTIEYTTEEGAVRYKILTKMSDGKYKYADLPPFIDKDKPIVGVKLYSRAGEKGIDTLQQAKEKTILSSQLPITDKQAAKAVPGYKGLIAPPSTEWYSGPGLYADSRGNMFRVTQSKYSMTPGKAKPTEGVQETVAKGLGYRDKADMLNDKHLNDAFTKEGATAYIFDIVFEGRREGFYSLDPEVDAVTSSKPVPYADRKAYAELESMTEKTGKPNYYELKKDGKFEQIKGKPVDQFTDAPTGIRVAVLETAPGTYVAIQPQTGYVILGPVKMAKAGFMADAKGRFEGNQLLRSDINKMLLNIADMRNNLSPRYNFKKEEGKTQEGAGEIISKATSSFTNHSGGAIGADSMFDKIGRLFGFEKHNHYWAKSKTPLGNKELTKEELAEGVSYAKAAAKELGRPWIDKYANLLGRNWFQIKNSTQVIAVAPIVYPGEQNSKGYLVKAKKETVDGGTGYAVEMAIANGKEVYVFDLKTNQWNKWNGTKFEKSETPILHENYAGIGSRQEDGKMSPESIQAIKDVYQKTLNSLSGSGQLKNMTGDGTEVSYESQPEFQEFIRKQLAKLFPGVKRFTDAEEFQKFVDKHSPGEVFDLSKMGAAIGNAVMINEGVASQSTQVHEYGHIYFDALPDSNRAKKALIRMYTDKDGVFQEEDMIINLGKSGTEHLRARFQGKKFREMLFLLKDFWTAVKNFFGVASKQEVVDALARKMLKPVSPVDRVGGHVSRTLKFMSAKISDAADTIVYNIYQLDSRIDPGTNAPPQMEILLADQDAVDDWVDMMGKNLKPGFTVKDIAETVNGQLLRRKQVTYTVHRAFHMPQVKNGILFGVKKAMAHGDPTKYKFPDINIGDEKQIGSIAWKNKHVGTPLHSFMQYIIEGKSFDDAYDQAKIDGLATIDKQMLFKNVYQPEMKKIAAIRAAGGEVMAETSIGHSGLKVGGKVDRVVVYGDGKTKIVDYKTSDAKVYDSNGNLNPSYTNPGTGGLASKEDGHFTQLETYAYVMGSKEDFGGGNVREAINVNEVEVMPIHFELDSSGRITDISLEKPITKPTTVDSTIKAGELLEKFYDAYIKVVQPGNNFIVPKTMEKVAEENHMKNLTTINSEIATNRTILQKLNAEKKAAVAAGNATLLNELNPKINSLIEKNENLLYQKKALQNLYEAYKQDLISISKIMEQNPKIEKLSTSELIVIYNQLVNYSMSAKNEYISALLKQVKYRLIADQALPTTENEGDITTRQVWSMAPSHFSEKLPVIRELMKHQLVATQKAENNVKRVLAELDKLDEAVRKEWDKNYSKNKIKLVKSTGSQYYENLYKKENGIIRPEYKSINDPTLNDAERAYLKFIWEYKQLSHIETRLRGANNNLATEVGALLVPESVFEEYHNNGFFAALHKFIGKNKRLNDVMVYGEKPIVDPATGKLDWVKGLFRYSDLINALDTPNVKSAVGLVKHTYYHTKYTLRAKKLLAKGFHDSLSGKGDGNAISSMSYINSHFVRNGEVVSDRVLEPMARTIDAQMQLRSSWFYGRSKNSEFSKDVHSAMQRFVMDMEFEAAMTEKSIELDNSSMSVMDLATIAQLSVQAAKLPNATRWMELWVNRELLGKGSEKYVSDLDRMASNFLISWTYLLIMTWNWKLGFFNLTTGILNNITFTDDYLKNNAKRLFEGGSPLWGKNNKARALWDAYEIVAYRPEVPDGSLSGRIVKWSSWFISAGEKVIQQTAFLARVPQAVWDNIDVDGDGKLTWKDPNGPQLDEKTITELKIKSSDVQGKYDPHDRRNYHGVAHLQLAMQFKTWLPDTFRQFFDGGSVDVFGNKHVGIVNAAGLWMKWALEAPTKGMAEANANYQQYASLEEYKAAQKNAIKSIAIMSAMWIMWAGLHGDDEDKEQADMLQSAMKQYMGMLDPDNLVAMISLPALNTIEKTKDAFMAIIGRAVYERDSRWGEAGEPKGFDKLIQAMPYRNLFAFDILGVKSPLLNENYGSGFGGGSFGGGGAGGSFGDSSQGGFDNFDSF